MTPPSSPRTGEPAGRALVLGGGGSTGNAWLIRVLAGLHHAGIDAAGAGLVVGTSAGATVAAQLAGAAPADLFAAIHTAAPPSPRRRRRTLPRRTRAPTQRRLPPETCQPGR